MRRYLIPLAAFVLGSSLITALYRITFGFWRRFFDPKISFVCSQSGYDRIWASQRNEGKFRTDL